MVVWYIAGGGFVWQGGSEGATKLSGRVETRAAIRDLENLEW